MFTGAVFYKASSRRYLGYGLLDQGMLFRDLFTIGRRFDVPEELPMILQSSYGNVLTVNALSIVGVLH